MKTDLTIKQVIHPSYFLSNDEMKMVEEFYADSGQSPRKPGRRQRKTVHDFSIKKPIKKLLLSAVALVLAATTVPFIFVTSEAKVEFDISKVEKMHEVIPELQEKYKEVSRDLDGLTGVVTFLVDNEKKRSEEPQHEVLPEPMVEQEVNEAVKVGHILKDKTALKLEKSANSKTIIFVGKDSKLVIKGQEEDWFLVSSPKGGKAWVHKDSLKF